MGLGDALSIAMAGLRANQAAMSLVSSNVANAETPGYVRKTADQITTSAGAAGSGVAIIGVNRELDAYLQSQLRTETSGASYASLRSDFLKQLQGLFGNPNSTGTLESSFNNLTAVVRALATSPDSTSARIGSCSSSKWRFFASSSRQRRSAQSGCARMLPARSSSARITACVHA